MFRLARMRRIMSSCTPTASRGISNSSRKIISRLGRRMDLFDFEAGVNLAGSRSYFLKGAGADLHQAVLRLAMDMMTREKGFTQLTVPVLVRDVAMQGTGFFPASREQAYHVDGRRSLSHRDGRSGIDGIPLRSDSGRIRAAAEICCGQHVLSPRSGNLWQRHRRALSGASVRQSRAGRHLQKRC